MPTLRGIDGRELSPRAWLHERIGILLRKLRVRADPVEVASPFLGLTLRARSTGHADTTLRIDADYVFESYAERRALYTDFLTGFLLPRTTIFSGENLMIRVNALGCRGEELEPDRPVIAFFGDSTTLGVMGTAAGLRGDSWTSYVDLPGYAILNAGVEGLQMDSVARRYESLRHRVPLACAVFYTGWHNLIYGTRTADYWEECLRSFLSSDHTTALVTLPTPLLPEMRSRGIDELVNERPESSIEDVYFNFWGDWREVSWLPELIDAHERFNAHVADFCRRTETPLIDLGAFMRPTSYDEAARDFFDVCHFRPRVYPRVAGYLSEELRRILPATPPSVEHWRPAPVAWQAEEAAEDLRRNIYPIW